MSQFKSKEEYEKWKAAKSNAAKSKTNTSGQTAKNDSAKAELAAKPEIVQNSTKKGKSRKTLFVIIGILTVLVLTGAVAAYLLYFRQANVAGLWTGQAELRDFMKSIKNEELKDEGKLPEELKDEDKLPVDVSLVLKHEDKQVISGKLTLQNFKHSNIDIPIDINGKVEGSKLKFKGENNMVVGRVEVDLIAGEVKNDTITGRLHVTLTRTSDLSSRTFRSEIELKRY